MGYLLLQITISPDGSLGDDIPVEILPHDYGGSAGPFHVIKGNIMRHRLLQCITYLNTIADKMKKKIESYRDWFVDDEKYGTDENKRPKGPKKYFWQHG